MAFTRPTLQQIIDRIQGDIKSGLGLTAILRRSFLDVISKALGGASHTLHGHLDFNALQLFPDTATNENLVRWATIFGVERLDATFTELIIDVLSTTGATLAAGTVYQRSDGVQYEVKDEVVFGAAETLPVTIVALEAGANGNLSDGSEVSLLSPISGLNSEGTVTSTSVEGEDQETIEALRTRLIERIQAPPAGGTVTDYIAFAKSIDPGVTRVWILPDHLGEGTVGLTFVEDNNLISIIPNAASVELVQKGVEPLKPISADLFVFAPTELSMDLDIALKPNTTEVQNAVIAELEDLLIREAQVRGAVDPDQIGEGVTFTGKIKLSQINEAISIAQGEEDHVVTSPVADVEPEVGGIVTLGTVSFSTLL